LQFYRREQLRLAMKKKRECDTKALEVVEKLIEPVADPEVLLDSVSFMSARQEI
jgi:hypothetical protein